MIWITAYISAAIAFFALDCVWLGIVAKNFDFGRMAHLMSDKVNLAAAAVFYAIYIIGLIIFAIAPAIAENAWHTAALYGALFGFFCYATYDMTNLATLKDWPAAVSIVDIAWGTLLSGSAATIGFLATRVFN